jgi:ABC-type phosphate/phosphonate transport system substrate-binding protein
MSEPAKRPLLASLPMYHIHRPAVAAMWGGIASRLHAAGVADVPVALTWPDNAAAHWLAPELLLSQACGFPLVTFLDGQVQLVGAFHYDAPGCDGLLNRSQLVVRASDPAQTLEDLRGRRVAINGTDSQSGYNSLRALVLPLARAGRFFGATHVTGAHHLSVMAVRDGLADVAAIDCVSLAGFDKHRPEITAGTRVLGETAAYPGLPLITATTTTETTMAALHDALTWLTLAPAMAQVREDLFIRAFEALPIARYQVCRDMRDAAAAAGVDIA